MPCVLVIAWATAWLPLAPTPTGHLTDFAVPTLDFHSLETFAPANLPSWAGTIRLTGVRAFERSWDIRLEEGRVRVEQAS